MSGFSNFTKDALGGLNNFENGMTSLANATEQSKAKSRLVNSQKYQIQESYTADLQQFLATLPMDTDQESYQSKATQFTQTWRSKVNEGAYDKKTLAWLNSDFLPSKKDSVTGLVSIAKDISTDVQTATYAKNFGTLIGSDRSLSYDEASIRYASYYEQVKLGEVSLEFGIATPEDYARSIVAAKTLQSIQNDTDQNIGNLDWSTEEAIEKALAQHEGVLTPDEKVQVTNNAYQYVEIADARRINQAKEESLRFDQALTQAVTNKVYCDPKEIDAYISKAPYRYSMEARSIKAKMNTYNDSISLNVQSKSFLTKGAITPVSVLQSFTDEGIAVNLMVSQLKGQAYKLSLNGYTAGEAYAAIESSDFWPGYDEALVKQAKLLAQAELASLLQSQLTEENRVAAADGVSNTVMAKQTSTQPVEQGPGQFIDMDQKNIPATQEDSNQENPATNQKESEPKEYQLPVPPLLNDAEFEAMQELQAENRNLGNVSKEIVKKANPIILETFVAQQLSQWGLKIVEAKGLGEALDTIDGIKDIAPITQGEGDYQPVEQGALPVNGTILGYAKTMMLQAISKQEAETKAAKHDATLSLLSTLRGDRYYAAHPEELKEKVNEFVTQGIITPEEGVKNSNVFGFVTAGTYPHVMSQVSALSKKWGSTEAERNRIEGQFGLWLATEYSENPGLYDDPAASESIQNRLVEFASDKYGKKQLKSLQDLTEKFEKQDGMNLLNGLKDGSTRGLLNKISSGELDIFINDTAQSNLALTQDGAVAFEWIQYDAGQLREFFTKQMGFADRYEDIPDNEGGNYLRYVVEANVAVARTKASVIRSFQDTFTKLNENPTDLKNVTAVWVGNTWAISDPEVKGLFWTPNLSAIKKPDQVDWSWGTMQVKPSGAYDPLSFSYKGSLEGFIVDSRSKQQISNLEESLANNQALLDKGTLFGMDKHKIEGFIARDSQSKTKLDKKFNEFYYQLFKARTAFGQGEY
jgi:hypothetical protein